MIWTTQNFTARDGRHLNGPFESFDRGLADSGVGANGISFRRGHRHGRALETLLIQLGAKHLVMSRITFKYRQFHSIKPGLPEFAQDGKMLGRDMGRPKKQIHAGFHVSTRSLFSRDSERIAPGNHYFAIGTHF